MAIEVEPPIFTVLLRGLLLVNSSNAREAHWGDRVRRAAPQRGQALMMVQAALRKPGVWERVGRGKLPAFTSLKMKKPFVDLNPLLVRITRISPGYLDHDDGVNISAKHVRDGVADALCVDDRDARISWRYAQRACKDGEQAALVEVFLRVRCPCCESEVAAFKS